MPLEIRELIIKASVGDSASKPDQENQVASNSPQENQSQEQQIMLIVEKVMEILRDKMER